MKIDDPEKAARLANAIVADIKLNHAEQIAGGYDLSDAVEEGRRLYDSRVDPSLQSLFEDSISELRAAGDNPGPVPLTRASPASSDTSGAVPSGMFLNTPPRRRQNTVLPLLLLLLIAAAGLGAWWFLHHG